MVRETGTQIAAYISQESMYGVPVAPASTKTVPVVSINFTDEENRVESRTAYSQDASLRSDKRTRNQPTFEIVAEIPLYASGGNAADSGFIDLMELAFGATADLTDNVPTYMSGDALFGISNAQAVGVDLGIVANSFTAYKRTITGHETGVGCIVENVRFAMSLDNYLTVTMTGGCKSVSKFQEGLLSPAIAAMGTSFVVPDQAKGRIGVGSYIRFIRGSGFIPATGGLVVSAFNPDTRTVTIPSIGATGVQANDPIISALPNVMYGSDYQEDSIFGDGFLVSVDGGDSVLTSTSGMEITVDTGRRLYNRAARSLSPVGVYQMDQRVSITLNADVDSENAQLEKVAERDSVVDMHVAAGGLSAAAGGLALFRMRNMMLRRAFPTSPRDGLSTVRYSGMARARGFGATKQSEIQLFIK